MKLSRRQLRAENKRLRLDLAEAHACELRANYELGELRSRLARVEVDPAHRNCVSLQTHIAVVDLLEKASKLEVHR